MYALPGKTQHKLFKVRGGVSLQSSLATEDLSGFSAELTHSPQPVFRTTITRQNEAKHIHNQSKSQKQNITPDHYQMINYVRQSWKVVEKDYKKSVNSYITKLDLDSQQQKSTNNKSASASTPLLLTGSYHHSSENSSNLNKNDSFKPFALDEFWENRIFKRLTEDLS